jgi:hypothetical protein
MQQTFKGDKISIKKSIIKYKCIWPLPAHNTFKYVNRIIHAIAYLMNWQQRTLVQGRQQNFILQELEPRGSIIIWHPLNVVSDQNRKSMLVRKVDKEPIKNPSFTDCNTSHLHYAPFKSILQGLHNEWLAAQCWLHYLYSSNSQSQQMGEPGSQSREIQVLLPIFSPHCALLQLKSWTIVVEEWHENIWG